VSSALGVTYRIRMEARDGSQGVLGSTELDTLLLLGQDIRFRPSCTPQIRITISPSAVVVRPGRSERFTATVTGTANTAVTWTATGGTITQAGLFTAGQTPGNYQVSATLAADPGKKGSAAVTIQALIGTIALDSIDGRMDASTQVNSSPAQPGPMCDSTRIAPKNALSNTASVECGSSNTGTLASRASAVARWNYLVQPDTGGGAWSIEVALKGEGTAETQSGGLVQGSGSGLQTVCFTVSEASVNFTVAGTLTAQPSTNPNQGNGSASAIMYKMSALRRPESFVFEAVVGTALFGGPYPNQLTLNRSGSLTPGLYCLHVGATGFASGDATVGTDEARGSSSVSVTLTP
jgi:hypothetical protein